MRPGYALPVPHVGLERCSAAIDNVSVRSTQWQVTLVISTYHAMAVYYQSPLVTERKSTSDAAVKERRAERGRER